MPTIIPKSRVKPGDIARIAGKFWLATTIHRTEGPEWVESDRDGKPVGTGPARWWYSSSVEVVSKKGARSV